MNNPLTNKQDIIWNIFNLSQKKNEYYKYLLHSEKKINQEVTLSLNIV